MQTEATPHVQLSISKLAIILIGLLVAVTAITTGIGLFTLHQDYRTLHSQQETEAHDAVRNAALAIRSQILFYQGMLQRISSRPEVSNLLEFGETEEIISWTQRLRQLLPGTLGTALTAPHGRVHGNPAKQRVGPACVADMQRLHQGAPIEFPPLHTDVSGLEHFDLLTQVVSPDGHRSGTMFVSFRLSIIDEQLRTMSAQGDRFALLDSSGKTHLVTGPEQATQDARSYRMKIPDTSWELVLQRRVPVGDGSLGWLIGADGLILALCSMMIVMLIQNTLAGFTRDMSRVHAALSDVLNGRYRPSKEPTAIKETGILLPDIERLALRLQEQRDELRQQSLSDPLTGVFNRRYFDMMLAHLHEQSRRQQAAYLLIVDVNDFKQVNDEFGHATGDKVLQNTARFLRDHVRATDIVARLGGDEFAVILANMSHHILSDWMRCLLEDYDRTPHASVAERGVFRHLSVGIAVIDAASYATAADVFNAADRGMYRVKQSDAACGSRFAIDEVVELTLVKPRDSNAETQ